MLSYLIIFFLAHLGAGNLLLAYLQQAKPEVALEIKNKNFSPVKESYFTLYVCSIAVIGKGLDLAHLAQDQYRKMLKLKTREEVKDEDTNSNAG